jgi:hypothetical protein
MNRNAVILFLAITCLLPAGLLGAVRFGPYEALTINSDVIRGVKVEENGEVWILLNPDYRERELVVKISNRNKDGYRKWHHGTFELVSPANQGKQANQWTDWVLTESKFIEYWMSDQLILHLEKVE